MSDLVVSMGSELKGNPNFKRARELGAKKDWGLWEPEIVQIYKHLSN